LYERRSLIWPVLKDYSRMGFRLLPELRYLLQDRIEDRLPNVQCPTMLVRGENDPLVPQRWMEQAARLVRAERVAIIPNWGHAVNYSAAEQLVDAITPFLRTPRAVTATHPSKSSALSLEMRSNSTVD
jgi:pimeloyl-ACP methyl ester carboxylesterase